MANYPHIHNPHDTEEETYLQWMENNGFPAMRELPVRQECEDVAVLC
jgi:hypothetical protein